MQSHSLSEFRCVVLYRNISECDVRSLHFYSVCAEGAHRQTRHRRGDIGIIVEGDDRLIAVLTDNFDIRKPRRHNDFLFIDAVLYEYHFLVFHESPAHLNGIIDARKLSASILCHCDSIGVVKFSTCLNAQRAYKQQQKNNFFHDRFNI